MEEVRRAISDWRTYYPLIDDTVGDFLININDYKENSKLLFEMASYFVNIHREKRVPRINKLFNYYQGHSDILFTASKKTENKADNRITSGLPKYIVDTHTGYLVGNPIQFKSDQETDFLNKLDIINQDNSEPFHEKMLVRDILICGKGYDIVYIKEGTNDIRFKKIDPATCFVVYEDSMEKKSMFAVRYYQKVKWNAKTEEDDLIIEVYTNEFTYYFSQDGTAFDITDNLFNRIPITEYGLNAEGRGIFESSIPRIDALELITSEMINSEEDFSNATLLVIGNFAKGGKKVEIEERDPETGKKKTVDVISIDTHDSILHLEPSFVKTSNNISAITPSASYLTKSLNIQEWHILVNELRNSILADTNTPNMLDENFSGNSSGVAITYKMWGADQEQSLQQDVFTKGLQRRMYLMYLYLSKVVEDKYTNDQLTRIKLVFTPNLPKNTTEIIANVRSVAQTGVASKETLAEMLEPVTGVNAQTELDRLNKISGTEKEEQTNEYEDLFSDIPEQHYPDNEEIPSISDIFKKVRENE